MRFGRVLAMVVLPPFCILAQTNPYAAIAERNVFGLKPPVVYKHPDPEPVARPVPNLVLSGVVDFSTLKWALITRTDPGRPPNFYTLAPGETEGGLQLLDINAAKATVTVRVDDFETVVLHLSSPTNQPAKSPPPQISGIRPPGLPVRR